MCWRCSRAPSWEEEEEPPLLELLELLTLALLLALALALALQESIQSCSLSGCATSAAR
jgi:hypothetical protein